MFWVLWSTLLPVMKSAAEIKLFSLFLPPVVGYLCGLTWALCCLALLSRIRYLQAFAGKTSSTPQEGSIRATSSCWESPLTTAALIWPTASSSEGQRSDRGDALTAAPTVGNGIHFLSLSGRGRQPPVVRPSGRVEECRTLINIRSCRCVGHFNNQWSYAAAPCA